VTVLAFLCVLGAVQAALFGTALFFAKNNRTPNRLLGAFAWVVAVWVSAAVMRSSGIYVRFPHVSFVADPFFFCALPLLYLYVRAILSASPLRHRDAWHFAPAVAVAVYLYPWYAQSAQAKQLALMPEQAAVASWFYIKSIALLIQGVAYIAAIFWMVYRHGKTVEGPMRAARAYVSRNARFVIAVLLVFWIAGIFRVLRFFGYFDRFDLQENLVLPFMLTVLVYLVCYSALRHPEALYGPADPARKYERSGLSAEAAKAGLERLTACMREKKPYLDGDLTLQQLASQVGLAPNHLSQVINDTWKMGFQEFLNSHRLQAAEALLSDPAARDQSILDIAYQVGFNSKSAFNAAFQRHRGMTPTEFRKKSTGNSPSTS
jgi:AraC-like DNA-binding protein